MFEILFFLVILIVSVILHEIAHGYAAFGLGDSTARDAGRLTLNPIPHIDILGSIVVPGILIALKSGILFGWAKPVPYNPYNLRYGRYGEAFVAAAGSITNISLAIIFGLFIRFGGAFFSEATLFLFSMVVLVNLFLGFLNLLPIPTLDGAKVLGALAPVSWRKWTIALLAPITANPIIGIALLFLILILVIDTFSRFIFYLYFLITALPLPF